MIYHLVYRSFSQGVMTDSALNGLLKKSRENNLKSELTGLLIYKKRIFLQIIEGDEKQVLRLYDKIKNDQRHLYPEILFAVTSPNRVFKDWNMALVSEANVTKELDVVPTLLQLAAEKKTVDQTLIVPLLQSFVKGDLYTNLKE